VISVSGAALVSISGAWASTTVSTSSGSAGATGSTSGTSAGSSTAVAVFLVTFFRTAFFFARARTLSMSTGAAVCTAVPPPPPVNQSRIVSASPSDTVDMWLVMPGISSALHLETTSLDVTPSSLAR
jgi:hypothetical protein